MASIAIAETIRIPVEGGDIIGDLHVPPRAAGLVIFAHGSGSGRFSSRNRWVADELQHSQFGTLLLDLLTAREEIVDQTTAEYRFDIPRLAKRVVLATDWALANPDLASLPVGYFGASTGAAAALIAAAERPKQVRAVVSRGGRPDLAGAALRQVTAPTLLIVGSLDDVVIGMNETAMGQMPGPVELEIVLGASHLFEEPGTLTEVSRLATDWFSKHLQ